MHTKQILSLFISLVFFAATGWLIYSQVTSKGPAIPFSQTTDLPQSAPTAQLLPYGSTLNFEVINAYNGGAIQPFPYPVVQDNDVSVQKLDLFKKASQ